MAVIGTNILALSSQSNLKRAEASVSTAMERLASGLRINSAKDDAAGQAIANRMRSQITGLAQAQRNSNDGVSLAQTAEGALTGINESLQRIRSLTVQALNGTNSRDDLASIQREIDQRIDEINRASTVEYNDIPLFLDKKSIHIQVGANDNQKISIDLDRVDAESFFLEGFTVEPNALRVSAKIKNANLEKAALTLGNMLDEAISTDRMELRRIRNSDGSFSDNYVVKYDGDYFASMSTNGNEYDIVTGGFHTLIGGGGAGAHEFPVRMGMNENEEVQGFVDWGNYYPDSVFISTVASPFDNSSAMATTIGYSGIATPNPLAKLDAAIQETDTKRSALGATLNRLESIVEQQQDTVRNLTVSRSRIEDADYAVEVASLTKAQILQQAGTSVLAQANQVPQNVLSLLN